MGGGAPHPWVVELPRGEGNPPGSSHQSHLCRQLPPRRAANPSELRGLMPGFTVKKWDKCCKKHPHAPGRGGAHGDHLQMSASSLRDVGASPPPPPKQSQEKSIFWEPFRLPTGCRRLLLWRRQRSQGLFLLPGSLRGLLPGRFPHPSFSFPARGPWEEGMPVSIAMRLALIRVSSLGELITESGAK